MTHPKLGDQFTFAAKAVRLRAARATTVLGHAREALDSRKVIGQAMGLLMHQYKLNEDAALEVLQRRARIADAEVHEIAAEMVHEANSSGLALPPASDC